LPVEVEKMYERLSSLDGKAYSLMSIVEFFKAAIQEIFPLSNVPKPVQELLDLFLGHLDKGEGE
jgi:hypothetical protein